MWHKFTGKHLPHTWNALLENLIRALHELIGDWLQVAIACSLRALQVKSKRRLGTGDLGERLRGLVQELEELFERDADPCSAPSAAHSVAAAICGSRKTRTGLLFQRAAHEAVARAAGLRK